MATVLLLTAASPLAADEVHLKGGGSISGRITERTEAMVLVDDGEGVVGVPRERIERIVEGRSPLDDYDERAAKLGPADVEGWRRLGRWAGQAGLGAQSREAYENVLAHAADDAEARDALGFVRLDGRWMTEEESYLARGFVKRGGEWMTASAAQALDSAEEGQRQAERRALDAQIAASEAEAKAKEAERRTQEEQAAQSSYPVYWGTWGYGLTYWPTTTNARRPATRAPGARTRVP